MGAAQAVALHHAVRLPSCVAERFQARLLGGRLDETLGFERHHYDQSLAPNASASASTTRSI